MDRRDEASGTAGQGCDAKRSEAYKPEASDVHVALPKQREVEQRKVGRWSEANTQPTEASRNEQRDGYATQHNASACYRKNRLPFAPTPFFIPF